MIRTEVYKIMKAAIHPAYHEVRAITKFIHAFSSPENNYVS
jgi:hypothetical protein